MKQETHNVESLEALQAFAQTLTESFRPGSLIALKGPLGAGKTTLVRAFVRALEKENPGKAPTRLTSPTFVFRQSYPELTYPIEHFDLYRLDPSTSDEALEELGLFEAMDQIRQSPKMNPGYLFVEWPDRAPQIAFDYEVEIQPTAKEESRTLMLSTF